MCEFAENVAFDKATNGQTDIKLEMGTLSEVVSVFDFLFC